MKKILSLLLVLAILSVSIGTYADFSDIPKDASYVDAVNRVSALGIMNGTGNSQFNPKGVVTREQFCVIIVNTAGLKDAANALKGTSVFPDVSPKGWSSGYINEALNKGFIAGMADGKFHPNDKITFAQACTIMVRALGYTDQDVTGLWPRNYIEKARTLGLIDGVNLGNNDGLPRWAVALMIDRLLNLNIKKSNPQDQDKTFIEASGLYTKCIILGDSRTQSNLSANQVLTDKGIYYLNSGTKLELGNQYILNLEKDTVKGVVGKLRSLVNISVDSIVDTNVSYKSGKDTKSLVLPDKTTYYYQGVKQSYDNLKNVIQAKSSIVLTQNDDKNGYEYAVIFDPVYSNAEIAKNYDPASKKLGSIDLSGDPVVLRNGQVSSVSKIMDMDVVYQVSDVWGQNRYILVVNSQIQGKITAVLPNRASPKTLQIDGKSYDFSKDMAVNKISDPNMMKVNDNIAALLGYDGKIVDVIYPGSGDSSNFAFVVNYTSAASTDTSDFGKMKYTVKLLLTSGLTKTFKVNEEPSSFKGQLISYTKLDDGIVQNDGTVSDPTVVLSTVPYNGAQSYSVSKDDYQIGASMVTNDVKIVNFISNTSGIDCQVNILKWTDMPNGILQSGKVLYINKVGPFEDVNLILLNDIFDQYYKTAYVENVIQASVRGRTYNYQYTLLVDGTEYTYTSTTMDFLQGAVVKVKMNNNAVSFIAEGKNPDAVSTAIQAMDSKRIKISNNVYWFKSNLTIYYKDGTGTVTAKGINDIDTTKTYSNVSVYFDKPLANNGKVEALVISQ